MRPNPARLDRKGPEAARTLPKTPLRRNAGDARRQLPELDNRRLVRGLGSADTRILAAALAMLREMFAE